MLLLGFNRKTSSHTAYSYRTFSLLSQVMESVGKRQLKTAISPHPSSLRLGVEKYHFCRIFLSWSWISIVTVSLTFFAVFQQELDTKHDKYERLVKISRDITIESKRTIFLLHRVTRCGWLSRLTCFMLGWIGWLICGFSFCNAVVFKFQPCLRIRLQDIWLLATIRWMTMWCCVWFDSVQDSEAILSEAGTKLDGVRQKIGHIAEELRGEDLYQFHRAFTPGKCSASFFH